MDKDRIIDTIIALEWELFGRVDNIGGRAECQDDSLTFRIMRGSQFGGWDEAMLTSYRQDLEEAQAHGRNPLADKYGYMMERTDPQGFAHIRDSLPPVSEKKRDLIAQIAAIVIGWQRQLIESYPNLSKNGRKLLAEEDTSYPSFETYLNGELSTYSERTLMAYLARAQALSASGENMNKMILLATVASYGFSTLEEAERAAGN
ncbi:MAG: DUF4125 family protein [Clostridiales Family XIII bacterium]|jgi:hypothetical protein|nr:DUF4125 family protein [Clostridiales Family XIII bacterium]